MAVAVVTSVKIMAANEILTDLRKKTGSGERLQDRIQRWMTPTSSALLCFSVTIMSSSTTSVPVKLEVNLNLQHGSMHTDTCVRAIIKAPQVPQNTNRIDTQTVDLSSSWLGGEAGDRNLQVTGQLHPRRLTSATKWWPFRIGNVCGNQGREGAEQKRNLLASKGRNKNKNCAKVWRSEDIHDFMGRNLQL